MSASHNIKRCSRRVTVGNTPLGADYPVRIQSMTKTDTRNVPATLDQCVKAFDAGADIMRISVPDRASLTAFEQIKNKLINAGYTRPLVADIHYRQDLAIEVAAIADKLRINPGNFGIHSRVKETPGRINTAPTELRKKAQEALATYLEPVVTSCRKHNTAIRLGGNAGSLTEEVLTRNPLRTLIDKSLDFLEVLETLGFYQNIISVKTSKPAETVSACRMMHHALHKTGQCYPMHIGVTEAGMGVHGRVSSALGAMPLLLDGIGDTMRISLTEDPVKEIRFAHKLIVAVSGKLTRHCNTSFQNHTLQIDCDLADPDSFIAASAYEWATFREQEVVKRIQIRAMNPVNRHLEEKVTGSILQETGIRNTGTRFISCPACARTSTDMESLCLLFSSELGHYPGVSIAIMGCTVNGPGEMASADYGVIASNEGTVHLYAGEKCIAHYISAKEAIERIKDQLRQNA